MKRFAQTVLGALFIVLAMAAINKAANDFTDGAQCNRPIIAMGDGQ